MPKITKPAKREIIDDFAKEIKEKQIRDQKPPKWLINFRTDVQDQILRDIVKVPLEVLRYRKDNGRISSDVLHHEKNIGPLDETDDEDQAKIREFLEQKDPEKTSILRKAIIHEGQRDPAIITCDGFLINGNRRKMVMEKLNEDFPETDKYAFMKVVILPGKDDVGGSPTLIEIEKIENRYQLQSDGRSEYYGFDRALSIKRKYDLGFSLEEQLRDDPVYAEAGNKQIKAAIKKLEKDYLLPLSRVDQYLKQFGREGQYRTVSTGMGDPKGRWQAFIDYSNFHSNYFLNPKKRLELNIEEYEIGTYEEAVFDIIKLRKIPDMPKVHTIMRNLPKYLKTEDGRKEIAKISDDVEPVLPSDECFDDKGAALSKDEIDAKWAAKYKGRITWHLKKAEEAYETRKVKETPLTLLEAAYKKLTHEDMDLTVIALGDHDKARKFAADIQKEAGDIEGQIYQFQKKLKKLVKKHGN